MAEKYKIQCPKFKKVIGVIQINTNKGIPHTSPEQIDLRFKCKRCKKFHWIKPKTDELSYYAGRRDKCKCECHKGVNAADICSNCANNHPHYPNAKSLQNLSSMTNNIFGALVK